jgi:hypothetical protein
LRDGRAGFGRSNNLTNVQFEATRPDKLSSKWNLGVSSASPRTANDAASSAKAQQVIQLSIVATTIVR